MFKKADLLIYVLLFLFCAALFLFMGAGGREGGTVEIRMNGELYGSYLLGENRAVRLPGGHNVIVIESGEVYMEYSDCPDKSCIRQGKITEAGQSVICLPNRVTVEINGNDSPDVDAVLR